MHEINRRSNFGKGCDAVGNSAYASYYHVLIDLEG